MLQARWEGRGGAGPGRAGRAREIARLAVGLAGLRARGVAGWCGAGGGSGLRIRQRGEKSRQRHVKREI